MAKAVTQRVKRKEKKNQAGNMTQQVVQWVKTFATPQLARVQSPEPTLPSWIHSCWCELL